MTEVDDAGRIALRNAQALVGSTIAEKFSLDRLLGMGGMGAVYAATNTWTGRRVAVKMLLQSLSSADAVARLQQEARAATSVRHPHILDVLDMCRDEQGNFLIVTELLAGESLESLITKRTRLDPYRAVQLLVPVAAALAAAHSKGVVHRDIKPDNIFLHSEGGQIIPKVIDFGISKVVDSEARARTQTGAVFGTVDYMSPEQARGERVDAQTDIWSLGVVFYRALTGLFPFDAPAVSAILIKIATTRAPFVRDVQRDVPATLAAIVDRMLEPTRAARYASFEEVLADLLAWADADRAPALSATYKSILPATPLPKLGAGAQPSSEPDTFSDLATVVDNPNAPAVVGAPTSMHWQRKSDEEHVPTTKIQRSARAKIIAGVGIVSAAALSVGLWFATRPATVTPELTSTSTAAQRAVDAAAPATTATPTALSAQQTPNEPSATDASAPLNVAQSPTTSRTNTNTTRTQRPNNGASGSSLNVRRQYE
jgi:serine/threonine protein kinase